MKDKKEIRDLRDNRFYHAALFLENPEVTSGITLRSALEQRAYKRDAFRFMNQELSQYGPREHPSAEDGMLISEIVKQGFQEGNNSLDLDSNILADFTSEYYTGEGTITEGLAGLSFTDGLEQLSQKMQTPEREAYANGVIDRALRAYNTFERKMELRYTFHRGGDEKIFDAKRNIIVASKMSHKEFIDQLTPKEIAGIQEDTAFNFKGYGGRYIPKPIQEGKISVEDTGELLNSGEAYQTLGKTHSSRILPGLGLSPDNRFKEWIGHEFRRQRERNPISFIDMSNLKVAGKDPHQLGLEVRRHFEKRGMPLEKCLR